MTQLHADNLSDLLLRHGRFIDAKDYVRAIATDDEFHRYIAEINLHRLWRAIEISKAQLDRCRHLALPHPGEAEATLDQHRKIIRSLNSGDPEQARLTMAESISTRPIQMPCGFWTGKGMSLRPRRGNEPGTPAPYMTAPMYQGDVFILAIAQGFGFGLLAGGRLEDEVEDLFARSGQRHPSTTSPQLMSMSSIIWV
ncbi:MAG: FCD domain-containing protein [Hyphomicrobiales bacterium]